MNEKILPLREKIDAIDKQLLELMNQRAGHAQAIGDLKKEVQSPVFHPQREDQVVRSLVAANPGPLASHSIDSIWREIMSACRALEQTLKVAFLGPQGNFTEEAAIAYFGSSVEFEPCSSIDAIFKAVSNENCRFGVVPIENSSEGAVTRSLDLLLQTSLKIVGEVGLKISHNLLSTQQKLSDIKVVYAHPQALAQCHGWLLEHMPHAQRQAVASNAQGAHQASLEPYAAAIASERAANYYKLQVLEQGIQDANNNRTRFIVLARDEELEPELSTENGTVCTSVVVSVPNLPGAVCDLLAPLKAHQVSLSRFESRPARSDQWEYFFYMDIAGHIKESAVAQALDEVRRICTFYKLLGSYSVRRELV